MWLTATVGATAAAAADFLDFITIRPEEVTIGNISSVGVPALGRAVAGVGREGDAGADASFAIFAALGLSTGAPFVGRGFEPDFDFVG